MDLRGSLVDTNVRIYPSQKLRDYLKTIPIDRATPYNVAKIAKDEDFIPQTLTELVLKPVEYDLNKEEIEKINKIKNIVNGDEDGSVSSEDTEIKDVPNKTETKEEKESNPEGKVDVVKKGNAEEKDNEKSENKEEQDIHKDEPYLVTTDIDWLYKYLKEKRSKGDKDAPFLHMLLQGVDVVMPENQLLKRNPILEERCVKLRAQQEAREYRKMTKGVDNVRIRYPEDSISYQLKQVNRQLIVIGQFILSIFAGFLFGFKGVEWMIGSLDFGFRLLLGVMCALIIALAEIYFLAKKLNEELNIPITTQLGGPPKFAEEPTCHGHKISAIKKEHKKVD